MTNAILFVTFISILFACGNQKSEVKGSASLEVSIADQVSKEDILETLDTTIILVGVNPSNYKGPNLSEKLAMKTLFKHFAKKGFYTDYNLPKIFQEGDETIIVNYDTTFFLKLNGNKYDDAIISYWLVPHGANGNGFKPHFAIISDTDIGYQISNEEFIPTGFFIDSTKSESPQNLLFGKNYYCTPPRSFIVKLR